MGESVLVMREEFESGFFLTGLGRFAGSFMANVTAVVVGPTMVSVDGFIGTSSLSLDDVNFFATSVCEPILGTLSCLFLRYCPTFSSPPSSLIFLSQGLKGSLPSSRALLVA